MRLREAKKLVAAHLANHIADMSEPLALEHAETLEDHDRVRRACFEFAEELYRRAGMDSRADEIDERQLSIYDLEG